MIGKKTKRDNPKKGKNIKELKEHLNKEKYNITINENTNNDKENNKPKYTKYSSSDESDNSDSESNKKVNSEKNINKIP